jgi:hypothetical protein
VSHSVSFLETGRGRVAIVHVQPQQLVDEIECRRLRRTLGRVLAGMDVILRCRMGDSVSCDADAHLRHHALNPEVDFLPVVMLDLVRPESRAA